MLYVSYISSWKNNLKLNYKLLLKNLVCGHTFLLFHKCLYSIILLLLLFFCMILLYWVLTTIHFLCLFDILKSFVFLCFWESKLARIVLLTSFWSLFFCCLHELTINPASYILSSASSVPLFKFHFNLPFSLPLVFLSSLIWIILPAVFPQWWFCSGTKFVYLNSWQCSHHCNTFYVQSWIYRCGNVNKIWMLHNICDLIPFHYIQSFITISIMWKCFKYHLNNYYFKTLHIEHRHPNVNIWNL